LLDNELRYVRVNQTLASINGLPAEEHIGKRVPEVLPTLHPQVMVLLERVLSTGQPLLNVELRGPSHPQRLEEHHYVASYFPIREANGRLIGVGATVHDVTPCRPTQAALHLSESRFRALLLTTAQVVWMADAQGEVVEDSPSWRAFTGQTVEESLGSGWLNALHPEDRERAHQAWRDAVARRSLYEVEYRVRRPDGSYTPTLGRGAPVLDRDGSLLEWIGTHIDISAHKHAENERERILQELQQAVRARDEFLTVAAHELRTPLTTLGLRLQTLRGEAQGWSNTQLADRLHGHVESMRRQVKRLADLVNSFLDVAQLGEGQLQLDVENVELSALVREVTARLADEAARAGCALKVEADSEVRGTWDRLRLEQVLIHLLSNALKYGAGRPVCVRVWAAEGWARLSVQDEGIGIEPEHQPRIFGRFERAVSERHYGGLGLGLYMTRGVVEALGGRVTVGSAPGAGATFTVELPQRLPSREGEPS
jgi:PAS domain S-box-containing protein